MFEGEHSGYSPHGDIAIDDVSFTPECRPAPHGIVFYLLVLDQMVVSREMYSAVFVWILRVSLLLSCFLSFSHPRKRPVQGGYISMSKWRVHFFVSSV